MSGKLNSRQFLKCSVAIGFSVVAWGLQDIAAAQAAALEKPPALNYKQLCKGPEQPLPLAADWSSWAGGDSNVLPERMLQDAVQLIEGGLVVRRDRPLARRMLEQLAGGQSTVAPEAKRRLAILLLDPRAGDVDPERAKRLLTEATAAQRTDAALTLGRHIREGKLPGFSREDAARYLGAAVGLGDPIAALELAALYRAGELAAPFEGATAHFETLGAINILTTIASGDCSVAVNVGDYLMERQDDVAAASAVSWYQIAADAGDIRAIGKLARAYELGLGVKADPTQALKLWDRAAEAGSVSAMAPAARPRLVEGRETSKALALLDAGMANDDPDSFLLAARNARGDYSGKADLAAMQTILTSGAPKQDASIYTLDMMGHSYLTGQGVAPDPAKAEQIYQRILATGLPEAEALYGRYKVKNRLGLTDGVAHLKRAVDAGSDTAKFFLADVAVCYPQDGIDPSLLMQQAAEAGSTVAMRGLARQLLQAGNIDQAIAYLEKAGKNGDRLAMVELAARAMETEGPDSKKARSLVEQAAAAGDGVTGGRLALALAIAEGRLGGDGGRSDELLASVADSAAPDVDVEIARRRLQGGPLGPGDLDDVSARLLRAAAAGEPEAMLLLSRFPLQAAGENVAPAEWLLRAAERGEPDALAEMPTDRAAVSRVLAGLENVAECNLPLLMQKARLQRLNGNEAAAEQVFALAEKRVARQPRDLYQLAQAVLTMTPSAPGDLARVEKLLLSSAGSGYTKAGLAMAKLYDSGRLGSRAADAINWYRKVALTGDISPLRDLSRHASLAVSSKDEELALNALKEVAEADNPAAMRTYGTLLTNQRSGRYAEGMTFLQKAADMGDATAMKTLAWHYAAGLNGEVSAKESIRWMRMAAEKGDPEAMFRYATALDLGFGVNADPQSAKSWHERAIKNGFVQ